MSSDNIYKACKAMKMRPACVTGAYCGGRCTLVSSNWYLSLSSQARKNGLDEGKLRGAYFYTARKASQSLVNIGYSHRWSRVGKDKNGDTFCVTRAGGTKLTLVYGGVTMKRVSVKGAMSSTNILKACKRKKMVPVCDYGGYYDGQCALVSSKFHVSHGSSAVKHGVDDSIKGAFFYTGGKYISKSLQNTGISHRWASKTDSDGDTYCARWPNRKFSFMGHKLAQVAVKGVMSGKAIVAACKAKSMLPVCLYGPSNYYSDKKCVRIGKCGHMHRCVYRHVCRHRY